MSQTFTTPKGTVLYLTDIQGKPYLQVQERLIWFREEHPRGRIQTVMLTHTDTSASAKATVSDAEGNVLATGHKQENKQGFPDFYEKAETGAIGRALANCGFGTQFTALEINDVKIHIVDSPPQERAGPIHPSPWDYVIRCGKTYFGKPLNSVPTKEIKAFIKWINETASPEFKADPATIEFLFFAKEALAVPRINGVD